MRTFFIVFLPMIGLFLLCALIGASVLIFMTRWSYCFVVKRRINTRERRALDERVVELGRYQEQSQDVMSHILVSSWTRKPDGDYCFTLPADTAERLIEMGYQFK